jgi:hypothetical protein
MDILVFLLFAGVHYFNATLSMQVGIDQATLQITISLFDYFLGRLFQCLGLRS